MSWATPVAGAFTPGNGDTPFAVTLVSGRSVGDDLFVYVTGRPATGVPAIWSASAGWDTIELANTDAGSAGHALFWRKATNDASDNCTASSTAASSVAAGAVMFRSNGGPASGLAWVARAKQNNGSNETTIATPALTVGTANCLVLALAARNNNSDSSGVSSWPGSMATLFAYGSAFGVNELSIMAGFVIQTTATNVSSGSINPTSAASLRNHVMLVALPQAAVAVAPPPARRSINPVLFLLN